MAQNVQIPLELLLNLTQFLENPTECEFMRENLLRQIYGKFEALQRRLAFTEYKTAPAGSVLRENLRKNYLDEAGISKNYRSNKENEV